MNPVQAEAAEADGGRGGLFKGLRFRNDKPPREIVTFEQNLEQLHLSEASHQLIERENNLFVEKTDEGVDGLAADHKKLKDAVVETLRQSLSLSPGEARAEALTSAVKALWQEEQQEQVWRLSHGPLPAWRPCGLKELHDSMLCSLVRERMDAAPSTSVDQVDQSTLKAAITGMGRQLKEDLLFVVDVVKSCYPLKMDICNFYARTYHQTFSNKVKEMSASCLGDEDCTFLLLWVNEYYPEILQNPKLASEIDTDALGKLVPGELLEHLETQYLSRRQSKLMTYISQILKEAEQRWNDEEEPKKEYGCYVSPVAYDMIQFINGMVASAVKVVGDQRKAQSLTCQLSSLMQRFKSFHDDIIRQNKPISSAYVKAHLNCVKQFRDVLINNHHLFPEGVQRDCLCVLTNMKKSAHVYLLGSVHKVLHPQYRMLGTDAWLYRATFDRLLVSIEAESQDLKSLTESCHQELIGEFHQEVAEEYVRRLLKGKVKLKDKDQQHQACMIVKDNATHLHRLFSEMGSEKDWLKEILNKIAEVLRLQDVPAIQMEIAALGRAFPDLKENQVSALLKLKTTLTAAQRRRVEEALTCTLREVAATPTCPFFSKVKVT
ncbi:tumor necrosis factor alpha-induced protein 2 [Betta splendens]|uniref:Tumor necrosis factor alpha-induced protein 2 n=1 Tax=Betta splendens TaxID=158456 RepID=A0A6P7LNI5_BETSP|nr:tumor necrosis factor alpha-induced protein 2 [Betta splendens]